MVELADAGGMPSRYGSAVRALVDVYIPSQACAVGRLLPVALFCHGGVWANGTASIPTICRPPSVWQGHTYQMRKHDQRFVS